jgi:hypothetical protein
MINPIPWGDMSTFVSVEATCLTWIDLELALGVVVGIRVHAIPDNVAITSNPAIIATDPDDEREINLEVRNRALEILSRMPLPDSIRLVR